MGTNFNFIFDDIHPVIGIKLGGACKPSSVFSDDVFETC